MMDGIVFDFMYRDIRNKEKVDYIRRNTINTDCIDNGYNPVAESIKKIRALGEDKVADWLEGKDIEYE